MFHIILLLLKIVGIVLLVVLGLLLLILACVLFVPLRYKGNISHIESTSLSCKIKWLFPLFAGNIQYDTEAKIVLRVLGIPVFRSGRKKRVENKTTDGNKKDGKRKKTVKKAELVKERKSENRKETDTGGRTESSQKTDINQETVINKKTEKKGILYFLKNIWYTIKDICAKLKKGKETIDRYITLWRSKEMVNSRITIWQEVLYLLRALKPKNIKGSLEFGFEDPSLTGYGMAVYGIFYSVWGKTVEVRPDFDNPCLKVFLSIKGKIRVFPFVKAFCKLYFDQDIRKSFAQIKKEI